MEAYSMDLRKRVLARCDAGHGTKEVAQQFSVSESWVRRLKQRRRELNRIEPLPRPGRTPIFTESDVKELRQLLADKPDLTLAQIRDQLTTRVSIDTVHRTVIKLGLRLKKSH